MQAVYKHISIIILAVNLTANGWAVGYRTNYDAYHYYRRDHLGNNREVWQSSYTYGNTTYPAATVQRTQYYPSGLPWREGLSPAKQPYKFNGCEFVEMHGYNATDLGNRVVFNDYNRFPTMDRFCWKFPWQSPYVHAANNPVRYVDVRGDSVWIYYGNQQKMLYTANMKYEGKDNFISASVNYLNAVYSNGGAEVMDVLIGSSNSFNMINETPTDKNGNKMDALMFSEAAGGGGDIYAGMLTNPNYSDYSKVEGVSHELFHGLQHELGQGRTSIFNEVEANIYSSTISSNWAFSTDYMGALSSNGLGNGTVAGNSYQQSFNSLVNGFSYGAFYNAIRTFKAGSSTNSSGGYNNYPLMRSQKSFLLKQYHPGLR